VDVDEVPNGEPVPVEEPNVVEGVVEPNGDGVVDDVPNIFEELLVFADEPNREDPAEELANEVPVLLPKAVLLEPNVLLAPKVLLLGVENVFVGLLPPDFKSLNRSSSKETP